MLLSVIPYICIARSQSSLPIRLPLAVPAQQSTPRTNCTAESGGRARGGEGSSAGFLLKGAYGIARVFFARFFVR